MPRSASALADVERVVGGTDRRHVDAQRPSLRRPRPRRPRRAARARPAAPSTTIVITIVARAAPPRRASRRRWRRARRPRLGRRAGAVADRQLVAGPAQVGRLPRAHDPEPDEADALTLSHTRRLPASRSAAAGRRSACPSPWRQLGSPSSRLRPRRRLAAVGAGRGVAAALGDQRVASSSRAPRSRGRRRRRRGGRRRRPSRGAARTRPRAAGTRARAPRPAC